MTVGATITDEATAWEGDYDPGEEGPEHVACADEKGWFYADEEAINAVGECLAWEDEDIAQQVITYTEAHHALAKHVPRTAFIQRSPLPTAGPSPDSGEHTATARCAV